MNHESGYAKGYGVTGRRNGYVILKWYVAKKWIPAFAGMTVGIGNDKRAHLLIGIGIIY